jgi:hypothetical protein
MEATGWEFILQLVRAEAARADDKLASAELALVRARAADDWLRNKGRSPAPEGVEGSTANCERDAAHCQADLDRWSEAVRLVEVAAARAAGQPDAATGEPVANVVAYTPPA